MIAIVGLTLERACSWVDEITSLPAPPAFEYTGFLISLPSVEDFFSTVAWVHQLRQVRHHLQIGAVAPESISGSLATLGDHLRIDPILTMEDVPLGGVPLEVLEQLRKKAVVEQVLLSWHRKGIPSSADAQELAIAAAAVGVTGRGVQSLCRRVDTSRASLYRAFQRAGLPPPGVLLRQARVQSVPIRTDLGMDPREARRAARWLSRDAYAKARNRIV